MAGITPLQSLDPRHEAFVNTFASFLEDRLRGVSFTLGAAAEHGAHFVTVAAAVGVASAVLRSGLAAGTSALTAALDPPAHAGDEGRPENDRSDGQLRGGDDASAPAVPQVSSSEESASGNFLRDGAPAVGPTGFSPEGAASTPSSADLALEIWSRARHAFPVSAMRHNFLRREIHRACGRDLVAPTSHLDALKALDVAELETIRAHVDAYAHASHRDAS